MTIHLPNANARGLVNDAARIVDRNRLVFKGPSRSGDAWPPSADRTFDALGRSGGMVVVTPAKPAMAARDWQDIEKLRRQLGQMTRLLRHKDLKLLAAESENRVMRQNIKKMTHDIEVLEKVVSAIRYRQHP